MDTCLDQTHRICSDIKARVLKMINELCNVIGFKEDINNYGICIYLSNDGTCVKLISRHGGIEIYDDSLNGIGSFQVNEKNQPWKPWPGRLITREELQAMQNRLPAIEEAFKRNSKEGLLQLEHVVDLF